MATHRALIIEDSREIADLVRLHLRDVGCEADVAADGRRGLELAARGRYDLVVLDLMLPEMDGLAVCREIRTLPGYVPILMLTAKSSEIDRVLGLEMGADDYLTKPFSVRELQARVKALFRRVEALSSRASAGDAGAGETIERGALRIETGKRRVSIGGREVALTAREFDLLVHFARRPGQVFNRGQLLDQVWGYNHEGYEHTVNSHINRLRAKIERDPSKPEYILTVWGVGYRFSDRLDAGGPDGGPGGGRGPEGGSDRGSDSGLRDSPGRGPGGGSGRSPGDGSGRGSSGGSGRGPGGGSGRGPGSGRGSDGGSEGGSGRGSGDGSGSGRRPGGGSGRDPDRSPGGS